MAIIFKSSATASIQSKGKFIYCEGDGEKN